VKHARLTAALMAGLSLPALAACTANSTRAEGSSDGRTITVTATDDSCDLSADTAPSGNLTYKVTNEGSKVTEFYLYGADGVRIVAEVENVGPGLSRDLVISVPAGTYVPACKPGMVGKGIRSHFTVTDAGQQGAVSGATRKQIATANAQYKSYVED
jgi:iron uptake system component EfeO